MVQLSIKLWFIQYDHCSSYLLKLFFGNHKDCSHLNQLIILYYITNTIKLLFSVSSFQNFSKFVLQARLQQDVNWVIPDVQGEFRKDRWTRDQITNIHWIIEKARNPRKKKIYFSFTDCTKAFDCVDYNKLWKLATFRLCSFNMWFLVMH